MLILILVLNSFRYPPMLTVSGINRRTENAMAARHQKPLVEGGGSVITACKRVWPMQ
jgi:hypothetical protein